MPEKNKKLFTAKRWTDIPQATVIGHREITEEEKEMVRKFKEKLKNAKSNND